jgi:kynurenine formamidase
MEEPVTVLSALVEALRSAEVEIVDLTAPLSPSTPILQLPPPFANTIPLSLETVSAFDADGPAWRWNNIHTGEHTGTHLDAPAHWISARDGETVDQILPARLVAPVVLIDVREQVSSNADFLLEPEHVLAWEGEHGPVPDGAWLLLQTGWSARQEDAASFLNADANGPHTPGPSAKTAHWLATERSIAGFGVETVGIDAGAAGGFEPPFPAHHFLLGAGTYGLTQLRNLELLPATGAVLVVSPLPIVGGTGSPSRVFALVEK